MSDTQVSDAPPVFEADAPDGSDRRRKLLVGAGVGAALLVVLGLAYLFFFSGGGSQEESLVVPSGAAPSTSAKGPATAPAAPATFNGDLGRNPFQPLAAEATPVVASTAPAAPSTAPAVEPTSASTATTVAVVSVNVNKKTADITVNGTPYSVAVGDTVPAANGAQITITGIGTDSNLGGPYVGMQLGDGAIVMVGEGMSGTLS